MTGKKERLLSEKSGKRLNNVGVPMDIMSG